MRVLTRLPILRLILPGCAARLMAAIAFAIAVADSTWAEDPHHAALDAFSGGWKGELQVFALDGFLLRTFPAQRFYAWEENAQVVVTRFFDGTSDYEVRANQHLDLGRLSSTVHRPGQPPEEYTGTLEAGAVVWTNLSRNKRDYSERLVATNGIMRLETTSSEIMRVKGVAGVVRVSGVFEREATAPLTPPPNTAAAESGDRRVAASAARVQELEGELREQADQAAALAAELATVRIALRTAQAVPVTGAEDRARAGAEQRAQLDKLARRAEAAKTENEELRARVQNLETAAAAAEEARRMVSTTAETLARDRTALRQELAQMQAERDQLARRAEELRVQPAAELAAQEAERRVLEVKLAAAERALGQEQKRAAKLEEELAGMRLVVAHAEGTAAEAEKLRASLTRTESELAALRSQHELLDSQHELLAFRARGLEEELTEARGAVSASELAAAEQRQRADVAENQLQARATQEAETARAHSAVETQARALTEREIEIDRLRTELAATIRARDEFEVRVTEMETSAAAAEVSSPGRLFESDPDPNAVRRQREELQHELTRLQRRVTELESERNASGDAHALLQSQLDQARQLRDDTLTRFQDVVAQLNTMREERDRLARANVSLRAELRALRGPDEKSKSPTIGEANREPSYLERLLGPGTEPAPTSAAEPMPPENARVSRTIGGQPRGDPAAEKFIAALQVIGITRAPEGDKVILNGRLYRAGDLIDEELGLVFERVDGDALLFRDALGHQYRRRF